MTSFPNTNISERPPLIGLIAELHRLHAKADIQGKWVGSCTTCRSIPTDIYDQLYGPSGVWKKIKAIDPNYKMRDSQ